MASNTEKIQKAKQLRATTFPIANLEELYGDWRAK